MRILGVSSGRAGAGAALVEDGRVLAAVAEERVRGVEPDGSFPSGAIRECQEVAGSDGSDIDTIVVHQKPWGSVTRHLATDRRRGLRGIGGFIGGAPRLLRDELLAGPRAADLLGGRRRPRPSVAYADPAMSSGAAAFYPSPHPSAAVLVVGEPEGWVTASLAHGVNHRLDVLAEQRFPHSLGALSRVVGRWCGLGSSADPGELARVASAGRPTYADALDDLVRIHPDGSVDVDARTFSWWEGDPGRSRRLADRFGGPPSPPGSTLTERDADLACSLQQLLERALLAMASNAHRLTGESTLCLSGSLAANPALVAAVLSGSPFEQLWVPPDVGTAGCALGAALWYWHAELGRPRTVPHATDG